ncbi:SDR family NAD(P)-dependent oxidoreductase [Novosphingobium sp. Gsoil 351]|uniref:SDR family NAD(P)-dependent oxidoreductase n=1 Tax=Novosphingobium sp. Gsoil 351 TaxID=2675225 RepID=UPI0012B4CF45|nr:SDR family oxidoreductase [Novosphingobium sp. Gsoil 351]QGN55688.1 SDR family oxidoreductase [Novosphingobium sp. Gsoil 351]
MSARFSGKVGLVTGAASGIGAAFARLAAAEGTKGLALLDRDADGLARLAGDLPCPSLVAAGDVGDASVWEDFVARIADRFGNIGFALANAGIGHETQPIVELDPEVWSRVLAVNLTGTFLTTRAALRLIEDGGSIVMVGSSMGVKPSAGSAGYGASKAGIVQLAKIAALEAAPRGIRVNAISPGGVRTPLFRGLDFFEALAEQTGSENGAFDALAIRTPLRRYASADEIAELIALLMSESAAQITGANLIADAGMTL